MTLTLLLVIVTGLISYQAFNKPELFYKLSHQPHREYHSKEYYRFISSGFVHADFTHLLINMYVLWIFGEEVERNFVIIFGEAMGRVYFLLLYLATIAFGDLPTFLKHKDNPNFTSVGASGAVSGIVFVFILFYPWSTLLLFFIIPAPAILAGVAYLIYSSYASRKMNDRIDHDAHFYGAIFGMLFTIALKPSLIQLFISQLINNFPL